MRRMHGNSLNSFLCALLVSLCLLAPAIAWEHDEERARKFEELEKQYGDAPDELAFAKARWLTQRGNGFGEKRELERAIDAFEAAIDIRPDYFPAYLSLTLAHLSSEDYDRAIDTIENAPVTMEIDGTDVGGFEYDVYYMKVLAYTSIPDNTRGLAAAREALEVLDDPRIQEQRERAEAMGVAAAGSGEGIIEMLDRYVRIQEWRRGIR
jgi:tetratricopeptide (TPR) repeat protein